MKKIFPNRIVFLLVFLFCTNADANYSITLKNGATFVTGHYWEEGNQVKCFLLGGLAGFDKNDIQSIDQTDLDAEKPFIDLFNEKDSTSREESLVDPSPPKKSETENTQTDPILPEKALVDPTGATAGQDKKDAHISITEQNHFLDSRDALAKDMRNTRYQIEAAKKEGNKTKQKEFERKFMSLTKAYKGLYDSVLRANGGTPPAWWHTLWPKDVKL
jgi:outer membrane murein-binding lipoprotein Lpp